MNPCRHCGAEATGLYVVPDGCVVFPDDRAQLLCPQHEARLDGQGVRVLDLLEEVQR